MKAAPESSYSLYQVLTLMTRTYMEALSERQKRSWRSLI